MRQTAMLSRRDFIALTCAAAALPRLALSQQAAKVPRVAYLSSIVTDRSYAVDPFLQGLGHFGWVEGKNIGVEFFAAPTDSDMPDYAAKAVASKPDVILANGSTAAVAAKNATKDIAVVFSGVIDPVALGLVLDLARPGANLTGNTIVGAPLSGKAFEILEELIPGISRVALFETSTRPEVPVLRAEARAAGGALGIQIQTIDIRNVGEDFAPYIAQAKAAGAQAIFLAGYLVSNTISGSALNDLALRNGLPTFATNSTNLEKGGLFAYGVYTPAMSRRSAYYVDAILKGAKPGTLAVELPTTFEFVLNMTTAKALGISVPASVLLQATRVVS